MFSASIPVRRTRDGRFRRPQDGETQILDECDLEAVEYHHFLLHPDTDGIDATLAEGSEATVETPGEVPLTFNVFIEIRDEIRTIFTADPLSPLLQRFEGNGRRVLVRDPVVLDVVSVP